MANRPCGPFIQYTNLDASKGRILDLENPFLAAEDFFEYADARNKILLNEEQGFSTIDLNPFVDPVTHKKYLYFVRRHSSSQPFETNFIVGMEMGELWSSDPKWETLTRLTAVNYTTTEKTVRTDYEQFSNRINEGPEMIYHNGTYYLTFSVDNCNTPLYSVGTAISTSPLGNYTKLQKAEGGLVLNVDGTLYEAADVDGATARQKLFKITLPAIAPTTFFLLMSGIIAGFQSFDIANMFAQIYSHDMIGGPENSGLTIVRYIYWQANSNNNMGVAAVMSWVLFIIVLVVSIINFKAKKAWVDE